jgi:hypothetical protein
VRKLRPDLKAVFSSGYTADIALKGIQEDGGNCISKPVNPAERLTMIRKVLEN